MWEVGGQEPGDKAVAQEVVPLLAEGVPELQQVGTDAGPVAST